MIVVVGLSHKSAPVEVREHLAVSADDAPEFLTSLRAHEAISEAMVLSTCNRVEIIATCALPCDYDGSLAAAAIEEALISRADSKYRAGVQRHLFRYVDDPAIRHVFRVAASLDSLVVGEPQILGQFKAAFETATRAGTLGKMLGRAVETALHVAKRVRSETQIGAGTVSISCVAVELARQIFGDLQNKVVTLVGAGKMAQSAARVLCDAGARLQVVNRKTERASIVAGRFGGQARPWSDLRQALVEADVVISSTSTQHFVLTRDLLSSTIRDRRGRSLFVVDIAVPRDVDPRVNDLEGVYLYDIDDLERIAVETMEGRCAEAAHAEQIVNEEADSFSAWVDGLKVAPTVVALREYVQGILSAELARSLHGRLKHLGEQERGALEGMLIAAVNKLTHLPATRLKAAAADGSASTYLDSLHHLFDLPDNSLCHTSSLPPHPDSTHLPSVEPPAPHAVSEPPNANGTRGPETKVAEEAN